MGADVDKNTTYTDVTATEIPPQDCQAPNGQTYTESCPNGQTGTITYTWQGEPTCSYKETNNCQEEVCQPTKGQSYTENCPSGQSGTITYTWDQSSCSYKKTENCIVGDCSDPYYKASHKAECCPGTPTTDTVCWKQTYSWGPRTSVPVNTTVTYNAYYVSSGERCNSNFALLYKSVYPDIVNSSASMLPCPGNDDRVTGQDCYLRDIGTGPQDTYCFYSLGTGYEYTSGVGFRGCKVISGRNGDTCECTVSSWPGHECVANEPQKNGW